MSSKITTDLAVDDPIALPAGSKFGDTERRYVDDQNRGVQKHIVANLIRGVHGTWIRLDSASADGLPGNCVCLSPVSQKADTVTIADSAAMAASGSVFGMLLEACSRGAMAHVALAGAIPASVTGLAVGDPGSVRLNLGTARAERGTIDSSVYQLGSVDASGNLNLVRSAKGLGGGGGSGLPAAALGNVLVVSGNAEDDRNGSYDAPFTSYPELLVARPNGINGPGAILIAPGLYGTNISVPQGPQRLVSLAAQSPRPGGGGAAGDVSARWAKFSTVTTHINLSGDDSDGAEFVGIYAATAFVNSGAYGNLGILNLVDCGSPLVTFTDGPVYIDGGGGFALGTIDCASLVCNGRNAAPNLDTGFTVTSAQAILASDQVLEVTFVNEGYNFAFKNCKVVFNATNFCISDDGAHALSMDETSRRYSFGPNVQHFADLDDSGTTLTNFDLGSTADNGGVASPLTNHACTSWIIGCNAAAVRINSLKRLNCPGAFPLEGSGFNDRGFNVTLTHEDAGSTAEYRIITETAGDMVIPPRARFSWAYDPAALRWRFWLS